jgi:hypothetical protein
MPQVDQAVAILGSQLAELYGQAAQVVAAAQRAVQEQAELARARLADEGVGQ